MKVTIGVSNHHVHLSKEDVFLLFGDEEMENVRDLNQPGQYVTNFKVDIEVNGKKIEGVKVLGPSRSYTQVELLESDCQFLGITCPVRASGDLDGSCKLKLIHGEKSIIRECGIIANRHLHLTKEDQIKYDLEGVSKVILKSDDKMISDVYLKVAENSYFEVHIDKDDSKNLGVVTGDIFEIIK